MVTVIGVRFKDSGKTYHFAPGDLDPPQGDMVIVETVRGPEIGKVVETRHTIAPDDVVGDLRPVLRRTTPADFERMARYAARHDDALARCAAKVHEHALPMKLIKAEYSFDGSRLTFYFTADGRVDFRALVRDLARTFRTRIELRQVGPREEAKLLGGIGPCGRLLCCATFLPDYARVSIKMAKDQELPLNPTKISGVCGRLLCCLSYEHAQYLEMRSELPAKGTWVQTLDGPGEVVGVNILRQSVIVRLAASGVEDTYTLDQIGDATSTVATIARQRNDEGITPPRQPDDAERADLAALEEDDALPAPPAHPPRKSDHKRTPRKRKPPAAARATPPASSPASSVPPPPAKSGDQSDESSSKQSSKRRRRRRPRNPGSDGS